MPKHTQRALFPGAVEVMALSILRPGELHGYAIAQRIQQTSGGLLRVQGGPIYQALQRLRAAKLVTAEWALSPTNRRSRVYRLTKSGANYLDREASHFERMFDGISRVLSARKIKQIDSRPAPLK
jgi:transcriptional regulator